VFQSYSYHQGALSYTQVGFNAHGIIIVILFMWFVCCEWVVEWEHMINIDVKQSNLTRDYCHTVRLLKQMLKIKIKRNIKKSLFKVSLKLLVYCSSGCNLQHLQNQMVAECYSFKEFLCFVDRASWYIVCNETNLMHYVSVHSITILIHV
jgi:hypothetical protein